MFHLMREQNEALLAATKNDFETADEILTKWDQKLQKINALHLWFENRLRLLATRRLAGKTESLNSLAETLEEKANEADDWLTIRRIGEVVGDENDPCLLYAQLCSGAGG